MRMTTDLRLIKIATACSALLSGSAFAGAITTTYSGTWNLPQYSSGTTVSPSTNFSVSGVTPATDPPNLTNPSVKMSGWANTAPASGTSEPYSGSASTRLEQAPVKSYNTYGIGVVNDNGSRNGESSSSGEHSMDNAGYGFIDSILFSFSHQITLTQITTGWVNGDSDITVLAYEGSGAPALSGKTYGNLTAGGGWTLVGHTNGGNTKGTLDVASTPIKSQYWLVSAYNTLVGGTCSGCTTSNDYVKLLQIAGKWDETTASADQPPSGVPEPASFLLLGLGLPLMRWSRRQSWNG